MHVDGASAALCVSTPPIWAKLEAPQAGHGRQLYPHLSTRFATAEGMTQDEKKKDEPDTPPPTPPDEPEPPAVKDPPPEPKGPYTVGRN